MKEQHREYKTADLEELEGIVEKAARIRPGDINRETRERPVVEARQAVWYMASQHMGYSASRLARIYGKDHTTVLSGIRKIREQGHGAVLLHLVNTKAPALLLANAAAGEYRGIADWRL